MNIKIHYYKKDLIGFISLIAGIYFLISGTINFVKYYNVVSIDMLGEEQCKKGTYVNGYITEYVAKNVSETVNGNYTGVSCTYLNGLEYDFYTIPIKDNKYIQVMVSDRETKKRLEEFNAGCGSVSFEGEIVATTISPNLKWYEGGISTHAVKEDNLLLEVVIRQSGIKDKSKAFFPGISLLLLAAYLLHDKSYKDTITIEHTEKGN